MRLFKTKSKKVSTPGTPPGPSRLTFLRQARMNSAKYFHELMLEYGDLVKCRASFEAYLINHPDHAQYVLQSNHKNYSKDNFILNRLKLALGNGLVTSEGKLWLRQRRLMQPAFHGKRISEFSTLITDATVETLEEWKHYVDKNKPLDVAKAMRKLSLKIAGKALFNFDTSRLVEEIYCAANIGSQYLSNLSPLSPPPWLPTPGNMRFRNAMKSVDKIIIDMIDEHRHQDNRTDDLLSRLQSAKNEDPDENSADQQILDEVKTLLMAGHENTANALTFIWHLLSTHPNVERLLHQELADLLGGRLPTAEDIPALAYSRMVIEETMRLYPPVWLLTRRTVADDEIGGYFIPANTVILLSPYVIHRHPDFWENPEAFDPTRFSSKNSKDRPQHVYLPFGDGPRRCIGDNFAMMELQLIIATLAQHFRPVVPPDQPLEVHPLVSLRPPEGVFTRLYRTQGN